MSSTGHRPRPHISHVPWAKVWPPAPPESESEIHVLCWEAENVLKGEVSLPVLLVQRTGPDI